MAAYVGYRPVLPGQNSNQWTHNVTGETGEYSNWQLQSSTHLLEDMPINNVVPGQGNHPSGVLYSQMYTGEHSYAPMELQKYVHGGQRTGYLTFAFKEYHGLDGAAVFQPGYGHDGTRVFTHSRYVNRGQDGVPSKVTLEGGHAFRAYGEGYDNMGPVQPYIYNGVGSSAISDPGETQAAKEGVYGFERVREHNGVPSSKAL